MHIYVGCRLGYSSVGIGKMRPMIREDNVTIVFLFFGVHYREVTSIVRGGEIVHCVGPYPDPVVCSVHSLFPSSP